MKNKGGVAHARRSQRGSLASKSSRDGGKKNFHINQFLTQNKWAT